MLVYAITNSVDGRRYIGMTECALDVRWSQHKKAAAKGSKTYLYAAMRKYGADAFEIEILAQVLPGFNRSVLGSLERQLIAQEGTLVPNGYNMTVGGDGLPKGETNPNCGRKASEETRAKVKAGWSDERKAAAREMMRLRHATPGYTEMVNAASMTEAAAVNRNKSWTPERRARQAALARMVCARPGRNEKIRATMQSEEFAEVMQKNWTPERRAAQAERMREFRSRSAE